jgi:hypothetical protein
MVDWSDGERAYRYPFGRGRYGLPESRRARAGTEDWGTQAWRRSGRKLNMRRGLDTLKRNPAVDGRRSWPLIDSFGRQLAIIERQPDRWELRDPATEATIYTAWTLDPRQLEVQGRGCMINDELEARHAFVAFRATDRSGLAQGASIVPYQLRAFIDRSALLVKNQRGQRIRRAIDDYDTGCGGSELRPAAARPLPDPGFRSEEGFLGEDGKQRSYATYNAKLPFGGAIYFSVNTTGVHGGGIARGVARGGDPFEPVDGFGYADPNVAEDQAPLASWMYGRLAGTRMWGWVPLRYG